MDATSKPASGRLSQPPPAPPAERRIVIGIPTTGRREILSDTVRHIQTQDRLPDLVVLSVSEEDDIDSDALRDLTFPLQIVVGPRGLSVQRNHILELLEPSDILLFLDDDFLMEPDYLDQVDRLFTQNPDVALATGTVIADGVVGRGYWHEAGLELLKEYVRPDEAETLRDVYNGYGCNMAIRAGPVLQNGIVFDEKLPLYSWLEDVDFSRQLAEYGRLVRSNRLFGVHLGTKTGRTPGIRLGYSQIVNPVYMLRKGTVSAGRMFLLTGRVFASNLVYSIRPREWTDSRGRLKGNFLAFLDILRGRIDPQRARKF
ncbi:glycosyltransferase family 2 protein [Aliiruegeria sabulilitoris]|uniref:glycosyltransferase family 2 protein n=1 Tax=Aliiruegeria sabulilitoris TaxID=1510458 RepID=UPI00083045C0|nr:glycosyltransferase [Aliiruegeria sabulilitoris]NDR59019.1 glycosyltransferase family 2 protein [Pseudoruegeria sp. M32A2M]